VSRIYKVINRATGKVQRYVRANTLNAAVRAYANELYVAEPATTEDMWQAFNDKENFDALDAVAPEQLNLGGVGNE
jgi:hypothetical protein